MEPNWAAASRQGSFGDRSELSYNSKMRSRNIPFKFDMIDLLARARRQFSKHVGNVTLSLPGLSIAVSPKDRERQVAREILIRLKDRRVLSSFRAVRDRAAAP
jgi:hypothetical protein